MRLTHPNGGFTAAPAPVAAPDLNPQPDLDNPKPQRPFRTPQTDPVRRKGRRSRSDGEGNLPDDADDGDYVQWSDDEGDWVAEPLPDFSLQFAAALFAATADKTIGNSAAEASAFGTGEGSLTLAANLLTAGGSLHGNLRGKISETGTPTLQLKVKLGAVTLIDSTALTLPASLSTSYFEIDFTITCRTVGATGTVYCQARMITGGTILATPATATATVDTTGTLALDATLTWGTADPANTLTLNTGILESLPL